MGHLQRRDCQQLRLGIHHIFVYPPKGIDGIAMHG
jgi:hypothetical protein